MTVEVGTSVHAIRQATGAQAAVDEADAALSDAADSMWNFLGGYSGVSSTAGLFPLSDGSGGWNFQAATEEDPADELDVAAGTTNVVMTCDTMVDLRTPVALTVTSNEVTANISTQGVNWTVAASGALDLGAVTIASANVGLIIKMLITFDGSTPVLDTSDAVWDFGDATLESPAASKQIEIFGEVMSTTRIRAWQSGITWDTPA